ncbi:phosphopyruvate hydratase, putative [Babesia ovata]|uniref:Phosphopyruvate hydratase, putative n=1 Tax=Babesia ovata TaxID=189622 RepID=A0A2H6K6Z5_9APIC|nr:phosphopyruvate hydratase, putative [Babesia ovata]GBE58766.1 phosphopyruvate hydratase, putative [Babesia ovata]
MKPREDYDSVNDPLAQTGWMPQWMISGEGSSAHGLVSAGAESSASIAGTGTKLLLNADQLVVLGVALAAAWGTSFDLASAEGDDKVGNEGVLSLAGPVGNHHTPAVGVTQKAGVDGLGDRSDLVHLQQKSVASLLGEGGLDTLGVGDKQVVTNNLHSRADLGRQHLVRLPVVLVEGVLNGDNGVLLAKLLVVGDHFGARLQARLLALETQVVGARFLDVELGSSDIHGNLDLAIKAGLLDGLNQQVEGLLGGLDVRGETTLVTHVGRILAVLGVDDLLQVVVDFATHADGLPEGRGTDGEDHELLHGQAVAGVGATVDDVKAGNGEDVVVGGLAGELSEVLVKGYLLALGGGAGSGHGNDQDSVGSEVRLAVSPLVHAAVQLLDHKVVQALLVTDIVALHTSRDGGVDVVDGLQHTLAKVARFVAITQLQGLVNTS